MSDAQTRQLVAKLWNYCDVLRDDGVSAIDYVEQLTYLLFLKMADERARRPLKPEQVVPAEYSWQKLVDSDGDELEEQYRRTLTALGKQPGILGTIFRKAQNKVQDPAKLKRLVVDLIGKENWSRQGVDVKGEAYENLLENSATDVKSGAGQYFTPRPLIQAIIDCVQPRPDDTIADPACGTGGFLINAFEYLQNRAEDLSTEQRRRISQGSIGGTELVDGTARLAAMNMVLHGIVQPSDNSPIDVGDSLAQRAKPVSLVLSNPPFGTKSSVTMIGDDGRKARKGENSVTRDDFWASTGNKQLNFVQHITSMLTVNGRAAVVLPDNVLFEGGAGEAIRRRLLKQFDVHTILRLPTGIFYAGGVKANVVFFERKPVREEPWTKKLWVYDFRTGEHFTLKTRPLTREALRPFVEAYMPGEDLDKRIESDRFKAFTYDELIARDKANLDITWLKDPSLEDAASLLPPEQIAREIVEDLEAALSEFAAIAQALAGTEGSDEG
ncbi:type I restriction-modification system subunit M [Kitasatospora sp. NBC_01266]|uniref:type I restriction-modification system subunit M n=1 Tax=Kitasatospora sp. NBC_01266 TaxID=2903572 RepID=UPI002E310402|nr:class I SAM-dependent DNA methyltransferase [Kitasatospora sp. NBC_01266]